MFRLNFVFALLAVTVGATYSQVRADVFYEGFATPGDYTDNQNLDGTAATTGTGWDAGWGKLTGTEDALYASTTSLTYGDLATTPGSALNPADPSTNDRADSYYRPFDFNTTFSPGDSYWLSALYNRTEGGNNWSITLVSTDLEDPDFNGRTGVGFGVNANGAGIEAIIQANTASGSGIVTTNNAVHFLVARVTLDAVSVTGNPTVDVWVDPELSTDLSAVAVGSGDNSYTRSYTGVAEVNALAIYGHQDVAVFLDEIRVGLSLADVVVTSAVPEPTSLAMACVGMGLMLKRRRVRSA